MPTVLRASVASGIIVSCGAGFVKQTFRPEAAPCNQSLSTRVPFTCRGRVFDKAKLDVWAVNLDFSFGQLSHQQWASLRDQYTKPWARGEVFAGRTKLFDGFDAERSYNLLDFLPMQVKGLDGFCFEEEQDPLPKNVPLPPPTAPKLYAKTVLVPNCWATVYEVLRGMSWGREGRQDTFLDAFSTDDKAAQAWVKRTTSPVSGPYSEAKRQFGDVMLVWLTLGMKRPLLQHAVIFIDQDIVFEKAGTGDLNPYRLTDIDTVQKEWQPDVLGGLFTWELRRPSFKETARTFADEFSIASQEQNARWPEFWTWPAELQQDLTLATADNPRDPSSLPDALTLLKSRRVDFCKNERWEPCAAPARALVQVQGHICL